ncbi:MAG TPA: hypothetical protein VFO85_14990, partial [Vicinamibacteria bacterium]|nr:hypothetical protein [Vicinamibacteria bacterium]
MLRLRARALLLCGCLSASDLALALSRDAPPPPEVIAAWNRVPPSELEALWAGAQQTAGIVAIEPHSHSVGGQAARKKAWGFLNLAFRLAIGSEPIWFPVDAVKRTVCGAETYWSYHTLHKERDVHPWLARDNVFEGLLDARHAEAVVGSRVLDLAHCSEMRGGPDRPCLYGEVTAPRAFDEWFCGGDCGPALGADPRGVPGGFGRPEVLCFHGPFVLERVHDWRPEIHPAEVMWSRPRAADPSWRVLLVPDLSERFSRDDHYARRAAGAPRRWTGDRPVELWVAFATAPGQPLVFDLAASELPGPRPAPTLELRPPHEDGAFQPLPAPKGMVIAARTWAAPDGAGRRGLLVLRAPIAATKGRARLFAL